MKHPISLVTALILAPFNQRCEGEADVIYNGLKEANSKYFPMFSKLLTTSKLIWEVKMLPAPHLEQKRIYNFSKIWEHLTQSERNIIIRASQQSPKLTEAEHKQLVEAKICITN